GIMRGRRGLSIRGTLRSEPMERSFPIVRHPTPGTRTPVLVSVPHYGTQPLPHITRDDHTEPSFETFAYGFAVAFLGDPYAPYYTTLERVLTEIREAYGYALLLDGHTGSPRRMKDHQVIIGTRHEATCAPELAATAAAIFTRHGFEVHQNVSGYTGGNIVATYAQPQSRRVHALQLEINASLLTTTTGEKAEANIARLRQCLREVLAALPRVLATVHED